MWIRTGSSGPSASGSSRHLRKLPCRISNSSSISSSNSGSVSIVIASPTDHSHQKASKLCHAASSPIPPLPQQHHENNRLPKPFIVYQSNHLLVLYKPPGWHSIPNNSNSSSNSSSSNSNMSTHSDTSKCLLTYCQLQKYGGGSNQQYVKPIHRIDQPCSGILVYGKTTKVASRIQTTFMKMSTRQRDALPSNGNNPNNGNSTSDTSDNHHVENPQPPTHKVDLKKMIQKIYYVMVRINHHHDHHDHDTPRSTDSSSNSRIIIASGTTGSSMVGTWHTLHGIMSKASSTPQHQQNNNNKGWSVHMIQPPTPQRPMSSKQKLCTLQYRIVNTYPRNEPHKSRHTDNETTIQLLQVRTQQGTRHMIRAILACYHMTVMGDVRYGGSNHQQNHTASTMEALPDQSVALHAYSLRLDKSIVDKTKKKMTSEDIMKSVDESNTTYNSTTGTSSDTNDDYFYWKASIPKTWEEYFHCTQAMIDEWDAQYPATV